MQQDLQYNIQQSFALMAEQREATHRPINPNETCECLFTRRKGKGKNAKLNYYFFTQDLNDLIISGTSKKGKGITYEMSLNSKEIQRESAWFVGMCSDMQNKKEFIGLKTLTERPGEMCHTIKINSSIEPNVHAIYIPDLEDPSSFIVSTDSLNTQEAPPNSIKLIASQTFDASENHPDYFTIKIHVEDDHPVCTFKQIADDEFEVSISHPLSVFQAFCIACVLINA